MKVRVTIVNETENYQTYNDLEDWDAETVSEVYRAGRSEYGKCVSKVYVDRDGRPAQAIGWVFEKRVEYTDCNETYLQHAWIVPVNYTPAKSVPVGI